MNDLKYTTVEGTEMCINPFNIGVWFAAQGGTAIEVNGTVRIFKVDPKKAGQQIRDALRPE